MADIYRLGFGVPTWCVRLNDGLRGALCFASKDDAIAYCKSRGIAYRVV
jgi:hypothetical protein